MYLYLPVFHWRPPVPLAWLRCHFLCWLYRELLADACKRLKRPPPKFKQLLSSADKFKCRVIVQDPKRDADKDLFFVPAHPVENEEQSKEEAALIALLHLTPDIPHERKLPDPYKTTWLAALEAKKSNQMQKKSTSSPSQSTKLESANGSTKNNTSNGAVAAATSNTNLVAATTFVSASDRRKQQQERQAQRAVKRRRHEAIRMANRDHPVFLSAKWRQQIQNLLRNEESGSNPAIDGSGDDDDDDETVDDSNRSDIQEYVEERLRQEGFTNKQTRMAYQKKGSKGGNDDESKWEECYEDCLQWLCVHLDKDDLPEGFETQGQLIGVDEQSTGKSFPQDILTVASDFGLDPADAAWVKEQKGALNVDSFCSVLYEKVQLTMPSTEVPEDVDVDENRQTLAD